MSDLDRALGEIWDATSVDETPVSFNAAVFERVAMRRARGELGVAAIIAIAVWAVASALGPAFSAIASPLGQLMSTAPMAIALGLMTAGLGAVALVRWRSWIAPAFWMVGLRV